MRNPFPAVLLVLLASAAVAISAADGSLLDRAVLATAEQTVNQRMLRLWNDNSLSLVGNSHAIYLPGVGLILNADINLAVAPAATLMGDSLTDKDRADVKKKKAERLPVLRTAMKELMVSLAASMKQVPANEQIAFVVVLPRYSWEEPGGLPMQIVMQATREDLLTARSAGAELEKVVRVAESR